ncbi:MAG: hypothetical protein QGG72_04270, partial [Verrucomicrobiota bacterium]|nr:hypothetical protein [Verrucomicrobiota bacterium]
EIHGTGDRGDGKRGYVSFVNDTTAVLAPSRDLAGNGIDLVNGKGAAKQIPPSLVAPAKKPRTRSSRRTLISSRSRTRSTMKVSRQWSSRLPS